MSGSSFLARLSGIVEAYLAEDAGPHEHLSLLRWQIAEGHALDSRDTYPGHATTSALIVSPDLGQTLLIDHKHLKRWLQPGGHYEPAEFFWQSAMREAVDKRGVHQRAFKAALAFYKRARKDPASFAIEIQHFDHYLECLGVDDMIAKEPTLPIDVDGQAKASAAGAVKEAAKPVAAKATRSNGEAKDTSVTLDDGTKLNPKFTDPAAEQHVAEQSKALN